MKIAFLLPVASDAHLQKRVKALENLGVQSKLLAFEREWYPGKPWRDGYTSLGQLQHRHYHKRFVPFMKALPTVRAAAKESDVIYAFGLDTLLLGWLATRALDRRPKIAYEVGDLGVLTRDGLFYRGLRWLERFLLRRVSLLVVTSEVYIDGYYQGVQGLSNLRYQVIENKLDASAISQPQSPITRSEWDGILRIGYFGLIRCRRSWETLKETVERGNGGVQVYVRGIPMGLEGFEKDVRNAPYIDYGGPYIAPDDLPAMYGQVDIVWVAHYMGTTSSLLWNRANRFYEACFFRRPMFAQVGTQDGQIVEALGLGVCVDLMDVDGTVDRILDLDEMELSQWQQNVARLPKHIYAYTNEHERLIEALQ